MTALLAFLKDFFPPACHDRVVLVGGAVRDTLLDTAGQDIDLIAALPKDELLNLGFYLVEPAASTPIYFKHSPVFGKIEVSRIQNMQDLEADLQRRDFTINAMTMDLDGRLFDPLGGEMDLREGVLITCRPDSFSGDPLRIFRAFRFECADWEMAQECAALIRGSNWSRAFSAMPVERFCNEMLKSMAQKRPERFFQRMIEFNVGAEFLPELFRMPKIPAGPLLHHPEGDLFSHSIQVLERVATMTSDPLARFCALFHDLGKLATDPALYPKHHGHDYTGFALAVEFCNRLRLPATHRTALAWISNLHGKANRWDELRDATKISMAEQAIKGGIVEILPLIAAADKAGGPPMTGWHDVVTVARMNTRELGIDQKKLETLPARSRPSFILQRRVAALRGIASGQLSG